MPNKQGFLVKRMADEGLEFMGKGEPGVMKFLRVTPQASEPAQEYVDVVKDSDHRESSSAKP